ncbi:peptidoglycan-recognition protein LD isoform X1 [Drosophila miranda]|uniref:peptidoglycan-recognition protein LD isoform X1 n=2 Tax=Drosophila miranda TaxID=7229 RepID=UPI0007E6E70B|nr:peptidoglycan-recognition protein LD isoform X1 [Drosophila miranda]
MPIFVSSYTLRAISKFYAHQEQSGYDKLAHLANQLNFFILAKLRHVLFALYFAMIALRHGSEATSDGKRSRSLSQGTYGSLGTADDIFIAVDAVSESSESTPLLDKAAAPPPSPPSNHTKDCLNWRSVGLLVMCVSALGLAVYLLWRQTQLPGLGYRLSLIEHDIWSDMDLHCQGSRLLDPFAVVSVYFTHTSSAACSDDCLELLHRLQQKHRLEELPYNFLITGDCQAFEARGWQYESHFAELPQATSLVVAFVGDFSQRPPSDCQLATAQALLLESLKRRRLHPEYNLFVVGNAEAVQQELQLWPRYAGRRRRKGRGVE